MLEASYKNLLKAMGLIDDPSQLELVRLLQSYQRKLLSSRSCTFTERIKEFFNKNQSCPITKMGVYIWGDVGRGKSMIMDFFFNHTHNISKKRSHFHQFMVEFHKSMIKWHSKNNVSRSNAISDVVENIAKSVKVICLDELQVNNIADAMVLQRLFNGLFKKGIFLFITSNFRPEDLFKDGLQRENFLPCIQLINSRLDVFNLNNHIDYRLEKISNIEKLYYWPLDEELPYYIYLVLSTLLGEHDFSPRTIKVDDNNYLTVLKSYGKTAMFSFLELCEIPLGILEYLAVCKNFRTIIITGIPQMKNENHNEALRFITLIDCIYEHKNKLICTAEAAIDDLYVGTKHKTEFKRTISRLHEMQSANYLKGIA
ncbi:MAG: hypothetical protein IRD7MM_06370 [Candidatus Midichloria mitochondrii]|nr:cell division protein ZapE [Candidatus Midichloria mitochondrii]MDJ1288414.1 cell division protein ZapE [Candidatus Midichloria mitochondrii]MDJ1299261.1 cell division protein ZapE [Candidatus Midichloria mitochondrii]